MSKLKGVLRYLKGTVLVGITYSEDAEDGDKLTAYVDSDHAGDQDKGYSTTGVVLNFAGGPVDWRSTKQTVVAISTVEVEYVAMSKACVMILHFRNLLESINEKQKQATVVFEDNSGTASLSRSVSTSTFRNQTSSLKGWTVYENGRFVLKEIREICVGGSVFTARNPWKLAIIFI